VLESLSDGVTYVSPRALKGMPQSVIDEAWRKAAEAVKAEAAAGDASSPARKLDGDEDGMFVTARFTRNVEPGVKALGLNQAPGWWPLDFADARGRAYFADTPPLEGSPTDIFQSSDSGFLELELEAPIPYKPPLVFKLSRDGSDVGDIPLTLL